MIGRPPRLICKLVILLALGLFAPATSSQPAAEPTAPMPKSPANGSDFVDADIRLGWSWSPGLAERQMFALRIWAEDLPNQEIWTEDYEIPVKPIIDSFGIDFGRFFWQVAIVNRTVSGNFASMGSDWSEIVELQRLRRERIPTTPRDQMSAAARIFDDQDFSASRLIDAVHLFVHKNSETNEQLQYAPDYSDAINLMLTYAQGESSERPRLLCDGRSTAMLTILKELGIESRLVFLYKDENGWISQHTVLEVFNPDTQFWQTHDVGSDFYYIAPVSGIRVNVESILFDASTHIIGCPIDGSPCSAEVSADWLTYFEALRYGHTYEVWVNPDRFDLSARFAGQGDRNLAEFIGAGDPRRVTFRLDSWLDSR